MKHSTTLSCAQRSGFVLVALLAAALAQAQNLNVTAANASNDAIYTVNFNNQTIHIENTDQGSLHSIRSLVFTTNGTNQQLDLLAADNAGGEIARYCGNFNPDTTLKPLANTSGAVVWNNTEGGPTNPDGLSVDSAGNLFLVNQGSGTSTTPQVWVMQGLATNCQTLPAPAPSAIALIDSKFAAKQTLEDTLIAKSAIFLGTGAAVPQINPGDLLVLTSNPPSVVLYQGSNGLGPTGKTPPIILLNSSNFPAGTQPGGLDFLPVDNSLLITTSTGTIFKYTVDQIVPTTGTPTIFVTNLGNGQFKVRTGQQAGTANVPVAVNVFVANNNGGDILEFDASGNPGPVVTSGVQHPQGLAVTNVGYQQFQNCFNNPQNPGVCNLLGNDGANQPLLNHAVSAPNVTGNILETMCPVLTDPRVALCGNCTNAANASATNAICLGLPANDQTHYQKGLAVAEVCGAGFDNPQNHLFIPNSMCGASGANSSGLTLVRTLTAAYSGPGFPFNGTYIETDSDFSGLPPNPGNDPVCATAPFQLAGWAPLGGEGVNPGSLNSAVNYVLDVVNGCATPHSGGGNLSLWVLGTSLNTGVFTGMPGGLAGFVATQYTTLLSTVTAETKDGALTPPGGGNFTSQLQQCIQESQGAFLNGSNYYSGAAQELLVADYHIASIPNLVQPSPPFTGPFKPDSNYPNPSGILRALLETTRFTVGVRLVFGADSRPPTFPTTPSTLPPAPPVPPSPTITGNTPSPTGSNGQQYTFNPTTADFAGNTATLTYSLTGLPWATLSTTSNNQVRVSGKARKQGSPFTAVLTVTDGCGASQQLQWMVTVTN
jgi:hypothetical protein